MGAVSRQLLNNVNAMLALDERFFAVMRRFFAGMERFFTWKR
jgi:hypothetical protein